MRPKNLKLFVGIGLLILVFASTAWPQNPMLLKSAKKRAVATNSEAISLPEDLSATQIDQIIAGLSDEQARRLLINELKLQAQREKAVEAKPEGIAGFIHKIKNLTALLQARIDYIRSGGSAAPQQLEGLYAFLARGERGTKSVARVIVSVAAVLAGALLIEWLFVLYTAAARRCITSSVPSGWLAKIGSLATRALLDFTAIVIFIVATLILFSFSWTAPPASASFWPPTWQAWQSSRSPTWYCGFSWPHAHRRCAFCRLATKQRYICTIGSWR